MPDQHLSDIFIPIVRGSFVASTFLISSIICWPLPPSWDETHCQLMNVWLFFTVVQLSITWLSEIYSYLTLLS